MEPQKKQRLEWLDAMRGFTMILVVANHVGAMAFEIPHGVSTSLQFLVLFRMPLFFFVSGFLAYKASLVWDLATFGTLVGKKLRVQIIPTVVFFLLAATLLTKDLWATIPDWLSRPTKGGYWFTIVLLYMFLVYYVFAYIESKLKVKSWIPITLLFLLSLAFYESCYLPKYFSWAFGWRVLHLRQYRTPLLGTGPEGDGLAVVLSHPRRGGDLCRYGHVEMAHPAHVVGNPAIDAGTLYPADNGGHVFPSLSAVFHAAQCNGGFVAVYRTTHT